MWCGDFGSQIQSVAIAWHIFVITHSPFDLGLVGLMVFLPAFLLVLVSGFIADHFNRRVITIGGRGCEFVCALVFLALIAAGARSVWAYLGVVFVLGTARALAAPAQRSILPNIVPSERFMQAQATFATARQFSVIGGPALGGALIALSSTAAFATAAAVALIAVSAFLVLRVPASARAPDVRSWATVLAGFGYIRSQPVVLGAISLDMFAVLFGGAVALLPVYADSILHVGPVGLGVLRSAPALGAAVVAAVISRRPIRHRVGRALFVAVTGFGVMTIAFGVSKVLWISLAALVALGAFDIVSVVIRASLVQLNTPDEMRGRVSAFEGVFITASNELGGFESGSVAALVGTVPSVVLGGAATLVLAAIWATAFPSLRNADRIAQEPP
jgi:MFS family permease